MARLVIISNRVALPRGRSSATGGLAVALRSALQKQGGVWMGWNGQLQDEPPTEPEITQHGKVTYAIFPLAKADHEAFYVRHANSTLWPLCHYRTGILQFSRAAEAGYRRVNDQVAAMLKPLLLPDDLVWVHDYHFFPLGAALRRLGVKNRLGFFLHIPFPAGEVLRALPGHDDILRQLMAYDLVGLQTRRDQHALVEAMRDEIGATVLDDGLVQADGQETRVLPFPIGIDTTEMAKLAAKSVGSPSVQRLYDSLGGRDLLVGADRLDYSKGIGNRLQAFGTLLEQMPHQRGKVTFLQLAPISRDEVQSYRALRRELEAQVGRINGRYSEVDWTPIRWVNRGATRAELAGIMRLSKVGFVTPLRDGMNLVAKEYVAAQDPADPGVLVLSRFAGAAEELESAILVNPYDADGMAEALDRALTMPLEERIARWQPMLQQVQKQNINAWTRDFVAALSA